MPTTASEYFERARSSQNFLASLFFSILAGGIFSLFLGQLLEFLSVGLHWAVYLLVFLIVSFVALRFSEKSETVVSSISANISSSCFGSIFKTFDHEFEHLEDEELKQYISSLGSLLTSEPMLEATDIHSLQRIIKEIDPAIQKQEPGKIREFLVELKSMLETIENISKLMNKTASEKSSMYESLGYQVKCSQDSIAIKKGKFRHKQMLNFRFESNLKYKLCSPIRCEVRISPFVSYNEFSYLRETVETFLNNIASEKSFLKIGLSFFLPTMKTYLQESFRKFSKQMKQRLDETIERKLRESAYSKTENGEKSQK